MNNRKPKFNLDVFDHRRLREIRKEKGYSAEDLCRQVYYSYGSVENGNRLPGIKSLTDIFKFLDLDIFTIAALLKCMSPKDYIAVRAAAKRLNLNLNDVTKDFINEFRNQSLNPDQEVSTD